MKMEKTDEEIEGRSVHIVRKWSPREISAVAIPADVTVGVNRSENTDLKKHKMTEINENMIVREDDPTVDAGAVRRVSEQKSEKKLLGQILKFLSSVSKPGKGIWQMMQSGKGSPLSSSAES